MCNIMDFPDEILVHIAYETLPDGIESLSQCSKRLSVVSKDALIQHKIYKKHYQHIQTKKNEGAGPFLTEVIRNPRCAEYIQHADFENCCKDVRVPLNEDIEKSLSPTLAQQPCVSLTGLPHFVRQATLGDHGTIIAMLLILLPRLETLIIPATRCCELLIRSVVQGFQVPMFCRPKLPLTRLENVTIGDNEWDRARPGQFFVDRGIKIFQELPSLRSLSCFFRTTRALDNPSIALRRHIGSISLHIFDLELSAEDLEIVLQHVRNVTSFTYIDRYFSSQVRTLDKTLQRYAGNSLRELLLQCVPTTRLAIPNHGFTSLTGFTGLKKVNIPLDTVRTLWNRSSSRPTFIEFLPASVEEITITGPANTTLASLVLDELAEAKRMYFPKLNNIYMSHIENSSATRVSAESAGIVLELDDEDEDDDDDEDEEEEDDEEEAEEEGDDDDDDDDAEGNEEIVPMEKSE